MMHRSKGNKGTMMAKIDLEKAYGQIDWLFLKHVLNTINFEDMLVKVVLNYVKSIYLSMLWNGNQLENFTPSRSLRQGDPLSPYLFVLCIEVLS